MATLAGAVPHDGTREGDAPVSKCEGKPTRMLLQEVMRRLGTASGRAAPRVHDAQSVVRRANPIGLQLVRLSDSLSNTELSCDLLIRLTPPTPRDSVGRGAPGVSSVVARV